MTKYWLILILIVNLVACDKNVKNIDLCNYIDLSGSARERITLINKNIYEFVSRISIVSLENTSKIDPEQIQDVSQFDNYIFLHFNNELCVFDNLWSDYQSIKSVDYFEIDTCNHQILVLKKPNLINLYSIEGKQLEIKIIPIQNKVVYSIKYLNDVRVFLAIESVVKPEIYIYNIITCLVGFVLKRDNNTVSQEYTYLAKDTVIRKIPLFIYSRDSTGLYFKYLFSDEIFKYDGNLNIDKVLY